MQSIQAHPRRTWSGIIAAGVAVALTVAALGLAQSASSQVSGLFDAKRATQVSAHLTVEGALTPRWPLEIASLESYSGVTGVEFWTIRESIPVNNGAIASQNVTVVEMVGPPGAATSSSITWSSGDDEQLSAGEALVGSVLAERLGIAQLDLQPEIDVAGSNLRVVGIVESSRSAIAGGAVFVTTGSLATLEPSPSAELFVTTSPGAARDIARRLQDIIDPYRLSIMTVDPVLAADAYRESLEGSVSASLKVLAAVAGLAGLIAVIFVNILSVGARTSEFGVRRAFGARRKELIFLVAGESGLLGLLGAAIGLGLGFIAVMIVTAVASWQPVFNLRLLYVPLGGALVFGVLGGLPPAVAAGRIQPADAVRS